MFRNCFWSAIPLWRWYRTRGDWWSPWQCASFGSFPFDNSLPLSGLWVARFCNADMLFLLKINVVTDSADLLLRRLLLVWIQRRTEPANSRRDKARSCFLGPVDACEESDFAYHFDDQVDHWRCQQRVLHASFHVHALGELQQVQLCARPTMDVKSVFLPVVPGPSPPGSTSFCWRRRGVRRLHPQDHVRRHVHVPGGLSACGLKCSYRWYPQGVGTRRWGLIFGAKRFRCAEVEFLAITNELLDYIITVGVKRFLWGWSVVRATSSASGVTRWDCWAQEGTGGISSIRDVNQGGCSNSSRDVEEACVLWPSKAAWSCTSITRSLRPWTLLTCAGKPPVAHCEERREAAFSRRDHLFVEVTQASGRLAAQKWEILWAWCCRLNHNTATKQSWCGGLPCCHP